MAVLVEAISVVIRRSRIESRYPGGWDGFVHDSPNQSLCADSDLARIGFMSPMDVEKFCQALESRGLLFQRDGKAVDLAVVDQLRGPTIPCDWLEFGHVELRGNRISACRIVGSEDAHAVTPDGWRYETSLSARHGFVPSGATDRSLVMLRREGQLDVYVNRLTGEEVYVGRTADDATSIAMPDQHRGDA